MEKRFAPGSGARTRPPAGGIHPRLRLLIDLAPQIQNLVSRDLGVTVTDRDTQLSYLPGHAGRLQIVPGDAVLTDSVSMTSMLEDRLVVQKMERRLGHDYVGRAVPIKNRRGRIIGSLGLVEVVTRKSVLKRMVVGKSPAFLKCYHQALKAARFEVGVLILGETGTGKEVIARLIAEKSHRRDRPFLAVNCASIPASLFESEMFGYQAGAFTGAQRKGKPGYFEVAQDGTIFLDEIGDLDKGLQAKLLRVIETGRVSRLGGHRESEVKARIISATNRDLRRVVHLGRFRADLYFRLGTVVIDLPPLRERREDLGLYIDKIFESEKTKLNRELLELTPEARRLLKSYDYPGNIRELENIIRTAVIICEGRAIGPEEISSQLMWEQEPPPSFPSPQKNPSPLPPPRERPGLNLAEMEKEAIRGAILTCSSKSQAAQALGISRDTLYRKLKKYGIDL